MSQVSNTGRIRSTSGNPLAFRIFAIDEKTLRHITGLVQFGFGMLNGLIGLRIILKLLAVNPSNFLAGLTYSITSPFLWVFQGLARIPFFRSTDVELFSLVAILAYPLLGWAIIQLMWLLSTRMK
jgi:hypothetical protein